LIVSGAAANPVPSERIAAGMPNFIAPFSLRAAAAHALHMGTEL
jgi:hypothetical protein